MTPRRTNQTAHNALEIVKRYVSALSVKESVDKSAHIKAVQETRALLGVYNIPRDIKDDIYQVVDVASLNYLDALDRIDQLERAAERASLKALYSFLYLLVIVLSVVLKSWISGMFIVAVAIAEYRTFDDYGVLRFLIKLARAFKK